MSDDLTLYTIPDQTQVAAPSGTPDANQTVPDFSSSQNTSDLVDNMGQTKLTQGSYQSANFATGVQGWQLRPDGAEFFNLIATNSVQTQSFTAQEAITAGQAVSLGDGVAYVSQVYTTDATGFTIDTTNWLSQVVTTDAIGTNIPQITVVLQSNTVGSYGVRFSIRANSAGKPTGADLASVDVTAVFGAANSPAGITGIFSTPLSISPATDYHILVRRTDAIAGTIQVRGNNTVGPGANASANSGSTWSANNGPLRVTLYQADNVLGQVSKSTSLYGRARTTNFIGFAYETKAAGQTIRVAVAGTATALTSLTTGLFYYLSDTLGAVSTTAGTFTRKVGISVSTTKMLITNIW